MTVSQAAPILEKLGLTAIWRTQDGSEPTSGVSQSSVEDEFVTGTDPVSEGTVRLWVQPQPPPHSDYYDSLDRGC
jgi:hypothetical protein